MDPPPKKKLSEFSFFTEQLMIYVSNPFKNSTGYELPSDLH